MTFKDDPSWRVADIVRAVAAVTPGISVEQIAGPSRRPEIITARFAVHLAHAAGHPLARIGREIGGRDHTSALNALRRVEQALQHGTARSVEIARIEAAALERLRRARTAFEAKLVETEPRPQPPERLPAGHVNRNGEIIVRS